MSAITVERINRGNQRDSVWWAQDFSKLPFNGTRQVMRGKHIRKGFPEHHFLGVRVPPVGPVFEGRVKFQDSRGIKYLRTLHGLMRLTPRKFRRPSRRWLKREAAVGAMPATA